MTEYLFSNNARGQLASSIGTGDTLITLNAGEGALFPVPTAGQAFRAIIYEPGDSEWVTATGVSGDTVTVTRNASPSSFAKDAYFELRLDEVALNNMQQHGTERIVTTDPDGSLAAQYQGEEVYQSVTGVWWKHCTGTLWKEMNL
jgi:hypothetical protein